MEKIKIERKLPSVNFPYKKTCFFIFNSHNLVYIFIYFLNLIKELGKNMFLTN